MRGRGVEVYRVKGIEVSVLFGQCVMGLWGLGVLKCEGEGL